MVAAFHPGVRREREFESERRRVERILRRKPGREGRARDADERQERGDDGDGRAAEAPGEVVLPEPAENQLPPPTRVKRASGRSSAICTVVTPFFIAQGRSWWCSVT